jgi:hypothetical protein
MNAGRSDGVMECWSGCLRSGRRYFRTPILHHSITPLLRSLCVALALACLPARPARAEHFDIQLTVTTARESQTASWDTSPPEMGVNPRPVVSGRAGDDVKVGWVMRSAFPHATMPGVQVHFYVVKATAVGQKTLPPRDAPHLVDTSFRMDFLPDYAARGQLTFRIEQPGVYLVRLTSEGTQKEHGHEHFSAVDLKLE